MTQAHVVRCPHSATTSNVVFRPYNNNNNNTLLLVTYQFIFSINVGNVLFDETKRCRCLVNLQVVEIMTP